MIRDIINGICQALSEEFGADYEIYTEALPQGTKEPCFFVLCINQGNDIQIKSRYHRTHEFSIQYFPKSTEPYAECQEVTERLYVCLELIPSGNAKIRGKEMSGHIEDNILIFTLEYDTFICRPQEEMEMEYLSSDTTVKG